MRRTVLMVSLLALALGTAPASATSSETKNYIGGSLADAATLCSEDVENPTDENIGGACFDLPAGTDSVTITVADDFAGGNVGWWLLQYPRDDRCMVVGGCLSWEFFGCDPAAVALTEGTVRIRVGFDGPAYAAGHGCAALSTNGTITVESN